MEQPIAGGRTVLITTCKRLLDVFLEYFPNESQDFMDEVLWDETGYPCFWHGDPEDCLRRQLGIAAERRILCLLPWKCIDDQNRAALDYLRQIGEL